MKIGNISHVPAEFISAFGGGAATMFLGRACGSEKLYVNIDILPPGTYSAKYHAHTLQEEFFIVLSGSGMLRMEGEETAVAKGDMVAKPCGGKIAHQFFNSGDIPMEILDVGTVETGDIAIYPDENVVLLRDSRQAYKMDASMADWDSDPNR